MTRSNLQFTLGLALGFLSVPAVAAGAGSLETNIIFAAAATMIAPRVWWAGMTALYVGQTAAAFHWFTERGNDAFDRLLSAALFTPTTTASPMLVGAVLGAILWHLVDRRRRSLHAKDRSAEDCTAALL